MKRRSGITGSTALRSTAMKTTSMTMPAAYIPMIAGEPQASVVPPSEVGTSSRMRVIDSSGDAGLVDDGLARGVLEVEEAADAEEGEDADGQA